MNLHFFVAEIVECHSDIPFLATCRYPIKSRLLLCMCVRLIVQVLTYMALCLGTDDAGISES